jgi:hypothetical protein
MDVWDIDAGVGGTLDLRAAAYDAGASGIPGGQDGRADWEQTWRTGRTDMLPTGIDACYRKAVAPCRPFPCQEGYAYTVLDQ